MSVLTSFTMTVTVLCLPLIMLTLLTVPPSSPTPVPSVSEENGNMNVSNLGEALFLLTSVFISAVQPTPARTVGLQYIMPHISFPGAMGEFPSIFRTYNKTRQSSAINVTAIMTKTRAAKEGPGEVLRALCEDTFPNNVVTVLHINNPSVASDFVDVSPYLTRLLDSVGLPVISWDTQFSTESQLELSLQLAPTLWQQTEAILSFLKKFSWKYFSTVTTTVTGQGEFLAAVNSQVRQSAQHALPNKYGHVGFQYTLQSDVRLTSGRDRELIKQQLSEQMDPDTRIILLHSTALEAKEILDVATELKLTGREYVWVLTATALGDNKAGSRANIYPLGLFGVTYHSAKADMEAVIERGVKVWMRALQDMEAAGDAERWHWRTQLACRGSQPIKRWPGGQLLYEYLKNVSLPGGRDKLPTAFTSKGLVTHNKLSILNVKRTVPIAPIRSSFSSSSRPSWGSGRQRGFRPHRSRFPSSKFPSSGSADSGFGRGGRKAGKDSTLGAWGAQGGLGEPPYLWSGDSLPDSGAPSSGFPSRRTPSSSSSRSRLSSTFRSSRARKGSVGSGGQDSDRSGSGGHSGRSGVSRHNQTQSFMSKRRGTAEAGVGESQSFRHRESRRHSLRRHRQRRSISPIQKFQEVATWDGRELTVIGITWPGNSSYPPKGVPDTYHLNVATYVEEPHVTFRPPGEKGVCDPHAFTCHVYERDENDLRIAQQEKVMRCCSGLSIDILGRISKELNFNFTLFEIESPAYGSEPDNSTDGNNNTEWTGLMGALIRQEVDVAMAALAITPNREEVIDFSVPFLETGITIVVAIRDGAISPTAFLEPYDYPSWTLILVFSVHATGASIFIFEWLSPYGLDQGHTPTRVHKFSLFRSFWLIWAMLFGAAVTTDVPRGMSSRFLANIWALFALVFLASYTANLAAFMITKEEYYDLSGIQDWRLRNPHHRHPPFKYATMPGGATETNIRLNHPHLYRYMKKFPQQTVKEAVASLKDLSIQAFIYDATTLEYAVGRDVGCKLKSVGKRYAETGYGVGFPKKSRWTKKFNEVLLRMQDDGEIERLQKFWLSGACHKKKARGSSSHTLGILNFTSAFILLGGGVVLGGLLLMLEHIYFRFGRKSLRKWDKCGCCSLVSLSMGQSLTFEQSVMEAIDMHKQHKCRDPLCETQLWKAKHELDIALLKVDQLKRQLARQAAADGDVRVERRAEVDTDLDPFQQKEAVLRKRPQPSPHPASRRSPAPGDQTSQPPPVAIATSRQSPSVAMATGRRDSAQSYGGTTTPTLPPSTEKSYGSRSPSDSPQVERRSPPRTYARRTRVNDGKVYENVDGGINIESTI